MPKAKSKVLRYRESHYAAAGLPFYAEPADYWAVPPVGGPYGRGGKEVGRAMGKAYLKHMAEIAETDPTPLLHYVVLSMRAHMVEAQRIEDKAALEAIHEQSIGFFTEVCDFIRDAMTEAPTLAKRYRALDRRTIEKEANKALRS